MVPLPFAATSIGEGPQPIRSNSSTTTERPWLIFLVAFLALLWRAPELSRFLVNPDHGHQLALGYQVLLGRLPFVDLMYPYGPAVAYTTALTILISNSLIPEIVLCAAFYAGSLTLLHLMASRFISTAAGLAVPVAGFLLLARFHKWYIWFFPLLALYSFQRYLDQEGASPRWWSFHGLTCGIAALYRVDFGIICFVFFALLLLAESFRRRNVRGAMSRGAHLLAGALALPILWLGTLTAVGGLGALRGYFLATFAGGQGIASSWALPWPSYRWTSPLAVESAHASLLVILPLTYLACCCVGLWRGYVRPGQSPGRARFMAAVGIMGFGFYPQGIVRADVAHLLQILPPFFLGAPCLFRWAWRHRRSRPAAVLYASVIVVAFAGLTQRRRGDLAPLGSNPFSRYSELRRELAAEPPQAYAQIAREVVRLTKPEDPILVIPYASQFYFFTRRPVSGLFVAYMEGIYDDDYWRQRNLDHVRANPPGVVVARAGFLEMSPNAGFRRSQPELYDYVATRYSEIAFRKDGLILLVARTSLTCQ